MALRYGVDTNVLLRLSIRNHPSYEPIAKALRQLVARDIELCFTPQNIGEFWNASTRPVEHNGFGLSVEQADRHVRAIERTMTLLPANEDVYRIWRRLLVNHTVRGIQVHDAHLVAAFEAHNVTHLITFNGADFKRFPNLVPVSPVDINA